MSGGIQGDFLGKAGTLRMDRIRMMKRTWGYPCAKVVTDTVPLCPSVWRTK